jgi:hypothetical protein
MKDESEESVDGLSQESEADDDVSELITDEEYIAAARKCAAVWNRCTDDTIEIGDDEQEVCHSENGAWVRAWLFVDDYDVNWRFLD